MYLSVQQAARRLGVSAVTIRRWTATGFLPCKRTAGNHRRIDEDDIEELARAIGGSNHLAARLARERELETLVQCSLAVASQVDPPQLLAEIARQMTTLLDTDFCAVSEYDPEAQVVRVLADYDASGRRLPNTAPYRVRDFPATRKVLDEQVHVVVNVDDPHADAAEVVVLRHEGDKSLLMMPMVLRDRSIGLLEIQDHRRPRHYSRQELRLCRAIAGQAAIALNNARMFAERRRGDQDIARLRAALGGVAGALPTVIAAQTAPELLSAVARVTCDCLGAISCVASVAHESAGAFGAALPAPDTETTERGATASVVVATDPGRATDLAVAVTLARPAGDGEAELLDVIVACAAAMLARFSSQA